MTIYTTTAVARIGVKAGGTETLGHIPQYYITYAVAKLAMGGEKTGELSGDTAAVAKVGLVASAPNILHATSSPRALVGLRASIADSYIQQASLLARLGLKAFLPGDAYLTRTTAAARLGLKAGATSALSGSTPAAARLGLKAGSTDAYLAQTKAIARVGLRAGATSIHAGTTTARARLGLKAATSGGAVFRTAAVARLGLKGMIGPPIRIYATDAVAKVSLRAGAITALTGVTNASAAVGLVASESSSGSQVLLGQSVDILIAAVRARTLATLTEVTEIPETLNLAVQLSQANLLPLAVIVAQRGSPEPGFAVFDVGLRVPIDIAYCALTDSTGTIDTAQRLRPRLGVLESAFMQDRRLGGVVTQTYVRDVPEAKVNEYSAFFAEQGQFLTVLVLGLDFILVNSIMPDPFRTMVIPP